MSRGMVSPPLFPRKSAKHTREEYQPETEKLMSVNVRPVLARLGYQTVMAQPEQVFQQSGNYRL